MAAVANARTLTVSIERTPEEVYEYVADLQHFPEWTTSFSLSARPSEDGWWIIGTQEGSMNMKMVARNDLGVLDHYVYAGDGPVIMNAMRVVPNGSGSEVMFTLIQQPDMSDEKFVQDAGMVEHDLNRLKLVMESRSNPRES